MAARSMTRAAIALLLIVSAVQLAGAGCQRTSGPAYATVEINGESYRLELAVEEQTRTEGLMGRTSIPDHEGMLFVFPDMQMRSPAGAVVTWV